MWEIRIVVVKKMVAAAVKRRSVGLPFERKITDEMFHGLMLHSSLVENHLDELFGWILMDCRLLLSLKTLRKGHCRKRRPSGCAFSTLQLYWRTNDEFNCIEWRTKKTE